MRRALEWRGSRVTCILGPSPSVPNREIQAANAGAATPNKRGRLMGDFLASWWWIILVILLVVMLYFRARWRAEERRSSSDDQAEPRE